MTYRCPNCAAREGYGVDPDDDEYVNCNACGSLLSKQEVRDANQPQCRCPFCGNLSSYTRVDFDIWQCDNCLSFLSSADFERQAPRQTAQFTTKEIVQVVLLILLVCGILFAAVMLGALS